MNNEPVAWIIDANMTDCDDNFIWNTGGYPDWQVKDWIPLYTHPAKILTDEEIAGAIARGWCREKNSMKVMDSDLAWAIAEEIRAILRKAQ